MGKRKPKPIVARHLFDFREVVGDRHVITTTVGSDLNPVVLSLGKSPDYRIEKSGASFAKKKADQPNDYRVHYSVDQWFAFDTEPTHQNIHALQPLGAEEWLLVRCRASSPTDRNAHVVIAGHGCQYRGHMRLLLLRKKPSSSAVTRRSGRSFE